jgi:hypothetical protein
MKTKGNRSTVTRVDVEFVALRNVPTLESSSAITVNGQTVPRHGTAKYWTFGAIIDAAKNIENPESPRVVVKQFKKVSNSYTVKFEPAGK